MNRLGPSMASAEWSALRGVLWAGAVFPAIVSRALRWRPARSGALLPWTAISVGGKEVHPTGTGQHLPKARYLLDWPTLDAVDAFFRKGVPWPRILGGRDPWTKLALMATFVRSSLEYRRDLLRPAPSFEALARHCELALETATRAACLLVGRERIATGLMRGVRPGCLAMVLEPLESFAILRWDGQRLAIDAEAQTIEGAQTILRFRDLGQARACLSGAVDSLTASGSGMVHLRGYVPLADAIGQVLERVDTILPR